MFKFNSTILNAVAETVRELTVERIREGVAKAKRNCTLTGSVDWPVSAGANDQYKVVIPRVVSRSYSF